MSNPLFSSSGPVSYQSQNDDSILEFSSGRGSSQLSSEANNIQLSPEGNSSQISPEINVSQLSPKANASPFPSGSDSGSFSWRGSQMDKVGTYQLRQTRDTYHLELSYNYARETTYLVTFLYHGEDTLISFRLTDPHGRTTEFTRI